MMKMFRVNIYLETSLKGPLVRDGWYAAVLEYTSKSKKTITREDFGKQSNTTYHRQAVCALIESLKRLNASCIVNIYSDSIYLKNGIEENLKTWKANGWINAKGEPIKNIQEWKEVARLISGHKVRFHKVKRHIYSAWMLQEAIGHPFSKTKSENKAIKNLEKTE